MSTVSRLALLLMLPLLLAGCGQRGDLYLPDDDEPAARAQEASTVPVPPRTA